MFCISISENLVSLLDWLRGLWPFWDSVIGEMETYETEKTKSKPKPKKKYQQQQIYYWQKKMSPNKFVFLCIPMLAACGMSFYLFIWILCLYPWITHQCKFSKGEEKNVQLFQLESVNQLKKWITFDIDLLFHSFTMFAYLWYPISFLYHF